MSDNHSTPEFHRTIVVGADDSESSKAAQAFALAEARRRKLTLKLVRAYHWGPEAAYPAMMAGVPADALTALKNEAEDALVASVEALRAEGDDVPITSVAVEGTASDVLLEESKTAFEVVVGSRHLRATGSFLLGSVGATVAAKAHCPVIVVRGPEGISAEHPHIVAAVDGTAHSENVLEYAFEEASRTNVPVQAVICWTPMPAALHALRETGSLRSQDDAEVRLSEALAGWREKFPDVEVISAVVEGHAVATLVEKSYGQTMLVVGRGTRHPRLGSLLGSTSQGVLHHATCPVAVVGSVS